jgi:hypothetical protein
MCFAILRVKYRNGDAPMSVDLENDEALNQRLDQLKENNGVASVEVFTRAAKHARIETWVQQ